MNADIAKTAARQHGVVSRAQLVSHGLSPDAADRLLGKGALTIIHSGVYAIAGSPPSFARDLAAAVLAAAPAGAASHRSAAALLELGEVVRALEISVPRTQRPRLAGVTVHRVPSLPDDHVVLRDRIRVTTVPRTLCDLASVLAAHELEVLLDHALSRRRVTCAQVYATIASLPRFRGRGVLLTLLDARSDGRARAESPLEQRIHALLRRAGLMKIARTQLEVAGHRLDVAFPASKLALEIDSYRHHSSRTDWARDHTKHSKLIERGWRILPVTTEDVRDGDAFIARVRASLPRVNV